jgi:hypothetical protein
MKKDENEKLSGWLKRMMMNSGWKQTLNRERCTLFRLIIMITNLIFMAEFPDFTIGM